MGAGATVLAVNDVLRASTAQELARELENWTQQERDRLHAAVADASAAGSCIIGVAPCQGNGANTGQVDSAQAVLPRSFSRLLAGAAVSDSEISSKQPTLLRSASSYLHQVQDEVPSTRLPQVYVVLNKVCVNILQNPNELKFRMLKKANPRVTEYICSDPVVVQLLLAMGFEEEDDCFQCPLGQDLTVMARILDMFEGILLSLPSDVIELLDQPAPEPAQSEGQVDAEAVDEDATDNVPSGSGNSGHRPECSCRLCRVARAALAATSNDAEGNRQLPHNPEAPLADAGDYWEDLGLVFQCCAMQNSDTLTRRELQLALSAFGFYPDEHNERITGGLDRGAFVDLLQSVRHDRQGFQVGRRVVPHARRGIGLGQLINLESVFVRSGWLQQKCDDFNERHRADIANGNRHAMSENLYALDQFVVQPATSPTDRSITEEQRLAADMPRAEHLVSFSELLNSNGMRVHYFVSHWWGHPYIQTVQALRQWACRKFENAGLLQAEDLTFWICVFAVNQHFAAQEVGTCPEEGPFNAALRLARLGAVMVLDTGVNPFKRIWCLYEVHRCNALSCPFQLIGESGPLSTMIEDTLGDVENQRVATLFLSQVAHGLASMSVIDAESSTDADKLAIWHRICHPTLRNQPLEHIQEHNLFHEVEWAFIDFDRHVSSLLATPLFSASLQNSDVAASFHYLGLGAAVSDDYLLALEQAGVQATTIDISMRTGPKIMEQVQLIHCAAAFGHHNMAYHLAQRGADVNVKKGRHQMAPIHYAAERGSARVIEILLDYGARTEDRDVMGWTPLLYAAKRGSDDVIWLLLSRGASANAPDRHGLVPLHLAAGSGHVATVGLLVHGGNAEVNASVVSPLGGGGTALHLAAIGGHHEVTEILLECAADVNAVTPEGATALALAQESGYPELSQALRRHGAAPRSRQAESRCLIT